MKRLLIALGTGVLVIISLFLLEHHMAMLGKEWASEGIALSHPQRVLMGIAVFWARFGVLGSPFILVISGAVAVVSSFIWPEKGN